MNAICTRYIIDFVKNKLSYVIHRRCVTIKNDDDYAFILSAEDFSKLFFAFGFYKSIDTVRGHWTELPKEETRYKDEISLYEKVMSICNDHINYGNLYVPKKGIEQQIIDKHLKPHYDAQHRRSLILQHKTFHSHIDEEILLYYLKILKNQNFITENISKERWLHICTGKGSNKFKSTIHWNGTIDMLYIFIKQAFAPSDADYIDVACKIFVKMTTDRPIEKKQLQNAKSRYENNYNSETCKVKQEKFRVLMEDFCSNKRLKKQ